MDKGVMAGDRLVSAATIEEAALRAASGFAALGVGRGDAVAWMLRNDVPIFVASAGVGKLGGYAVPVNWHLTGEEVAYQLRDSGAKALVVHADFYRSIAPALPADIAVLVVRTPAEILTGYRLDAGLGEVPAGAIPWESWLAAQTPWTAPPLAAPSSMMYTSGTTGRPKGVRREPPTPQQATSMARHSQAIYGVRPGMRTVITPPLYHAAPNSYGLMSQRMADSLVVLQPRFDAAALLAQIARFRITHLFMVPIMFVRLLKLPAEERRRHDLSSLEWVTHAGAPCPPDVKRAMIDWWGPVLHEYYGSTESGAITHCDSAAWLARPGTVGQPVSDARIVIRAPDGTALGPMQEGEVYCRRLDLPEFTYRHDDEKRRGIEIEGLITNGDVGYLDEDGYLFLCDRAKDMVISGGVNIYPAEIEAALLTCPGVRDCAVFGIPDAEFGEALAAAVEPDPAAPPDVAAIRAHLAARIASYKMPKVIALHAALPREDTGKIFKRRLRDPYWQQAGRRI